MNKNFGTLLNCMDGRTQLPAINWIRNNFNVEYVDIISEPGIDKLIYLKNKDFLKSIENKLFISLKKHNSDIIFIAGHYDCAANDANKSEHIKHIKASVKILKKLHDDVKIIGLWIDENFEVEVCCEDSTL
ncbi:hypothetical protein D4Z93_02485 [Clostridium fermenticellae]|uniref:Uncharacterized protein n=1 Tax=Clostridium fermenticellae TaxID=2068654 RepID=A0A386H1P3_9CLOT|nr:carbonic anhydrase [Clostridium fermenticellae]AYD39465.1 hypothetical protein D4Z93_02485 [Clostridium fermenticellae]